MTNLKLYFNKEEIVRAINREAVKENSKITVGDLDEAVCMIRLVDTIKLDKKNKMVLFMVKSFDTSTIKLGSEYHIIERKGMYDVIRESMKEQLINKEYVTNRRYGYVLLGYDVEADDHDVIAALEISGLLQDKVV